MQIADCPGRGEPGSGELDLDGLLGELAARGYDGWVGLEYKPTTTTEASLAWLPRPARRRQPPDHARQRSSIMTTIAFIGLGIMGQPDGRPPAERRLRRLRRQPLARAAPAARRGRRTRGGVRLAEAVKGADVVAVMVPDSPDVEQVLAGEGGVFDNAPSRAP